MIKPEPSELTRRGERLGAVVAALAAAVFEELLEELLERRAGRQVRHRRVARLDLLRGGDVDHRVDHLFGDVGNIFRPARQLGVARVGSASAAAAQARSAPVAGRCAQER